MMNFNAIAADRLLSRKTNSVSRDKGRNQIIITETISQYGVHEKADTKVNEVIREETYYFFFPDNDSVNVNELLVKSRDAATAMFIGLTYDGNTIAVPAAPAPAPEKVVVEEPVVEEAPAKPKAKTVKKRAAKKAVAKKAVKKAEPAPEVEEEIDLDLDLDEPVVEEAPVVVLFDKGDRTHRAKVSPILVKVLGDDWKSDDANKLKVSKLLVALHGKADIAKLEQKITKALS